MKICHACKKNLEVGQSIGRRDECLFCGADLHCCLNCRFYDRAAPKQCREPLAELVKEKAKANFCDYFVFKEAGAAGNEKSEAEQARAALNNLFKK